MGEFKGVNYKLFGKKKAQSTPDGFYWRKLGVPVFLKEFGPINYIDFSPAEPHYFAVTSSVRIQVYSPVTKLVHKNLSRFQKCAYGGSFRSDGKLICAGGEENLVKLFDVSSKSLLRVFEGHMGPVHRCFFTIDNTHIASFSDDRTVKLWDIPSEKEVISYSNHNVSIVHKVSTFANCLKASEPKDSVKAFLCLKDYVRAGAVSPVSADVILSGGYDGFVKMYDKRSDKVVFNLKHGSPVESIIFLPTGGIFLSSGGPEIKVWDAFCGGRLLARLCNHHKTVTSLCVARKRGRILSGSLDRHVNVYDITTFEKVHFMDYPNSVLSIGISANDEIIAVGMVDGLVSVSKRETDTKMGSHENRQRTFKATNDAKAAAADAVIKERKTLRMARYNHYLKKFEFTKALKAVLTPLVTFKTPEVTMALLQELLYRKALHSAIAGNEDKVVEPFLNFLIKYIGDHRFTRVLIDVANVFFDVYEDTITDFGPEAVALFMKLSAKLKEEIELTESLLELEGCIELVVSASRQFSATTSAKAQAPLRPSDRARDFVVNIS